MVKPKDCLRPLLQNSIHCHQCMTKGRCPKKKRDFLGIFPKGGGGVFSNPKTFVNLPSVFLYAKIILRCQNMFYNSGEVISDQFHHITLDSKSGKFWKKSAKTRSFGNFFHCEGGGSPIPKSICQNSYQKVNIFVKTKNAPNDLKCKINHTFFLETGVPGSFILHLLLGLCWDCVGICWDRSQQSPSQTPTNHPSGFI